MKVKDLWSGCTVFLTLNLGRAGTVSYYFQVISWDPETKLFTIKGLTDVLFGKNKVGVVKSWREDGWHHWHVEESCFAQLSSLPSKLDKSHDDLRAIYTANLKRWRDSKKEVKKHV